MDDEAARLDQGRHPFAAPVCGVGARGAEDPPDPPRCAASAACAQRRLAVQGRLEGDRPIELRGCVLAARACDTEKDPESRVATVSDGVTVIDAECSPTGWDSTTVLLASWLSDLVREAQS